MTKTTEIKEMQMNAFKKGVVFALAVWWGLLGTAWGDEARFAQILLQAEAAGEKIPVLTLLYPEMDVDMAYGIQKAYVEQKKKTTPIAGFKAGLTSDGAQKRFGLTDPVTGVLFASGQLASPALVDASRFSLPMIETEIGFVLGRRLTRPLADVAELKACVIAMQPVIELPDLGFARMEGLKGEDIIAANVSSRMFVTGSRHPPDLTDPNGVVVTLSLNGQEIHQGKGSDALGNQWQAALWMVNQLLDQGWAFEPGHVIITGALGKMIPGKPGRYIADYGILGSVLFEIR